MASSRNSPSEAVAARVAARIAPGSTACVGLSGGLDSVVLLDVLGHARDTIDFSLRAVHVHHGLSPHAEGWTRFWQAVPPAYYQDLFGLMRQGELRIEGDIRQFWARVMYVKGVMGALRGQAGQV